MTHPMSEELKRVAESLAMTARYSNSQGLRPELVPVAREVLEGSAAALHGAADALDDLAGRAKDAEDLIKKYEHHLHRMVNHYRGGRPWEWEDFAEEARIALREAEIKTLTNKDT